MIIIGLAGRAGSGKSTCGEWLRREYGAQLFSLAEPLKRLAQDVFQFTDEQVFGTQEQKEKIDWRWNMSPRDALIRLGNSARERLGANVWLDACLNSIYDANPKLAVITDVRYPNEAAGIVGSGLCSYVIRLSCPDAQTNVDPNAPSERSVDEINEHLLYAHLDVRRSTGASELVKAFAETVRPIVSK